MFVFNRLVPTRADARPAGLFDQFFQGLLDDPILTPAASGEPAWPHADIVEDGDSVSVRLEVPGVAAADVDVEALGDVLTIRGEKKSATQGREGGIYRAESRAGSFSRSFRFPADIARDQVRADLRDGILTVRVPKPVAAKPQRIEVKSQPESPAPSGPAAA